MPVNGILKGIENSSLGSRFLICIYSKFQSGPSIIVTLEEKIYVLKNKDASCKVLFRKTIEERP